MNKLDNKSNKNLNRRKKSRKRPNLEEQKNWFKIDNSAKLYPSITSTRVSTIFRFSAKLTSIVDPDKLQKALNSVMPLFPGFQVNMKKGFFWYYFEKSSVMPIIEEETYYPCMFLYYKNKDTLPFRVMYFNNRISVEMSHSLTDGMGTITFLRAILAAYAKLIGLAPNIDVSHSIGNITKVENVFEDAAARNYKENLPSPDKLKDAFHLPFELDDKGKYNVITGIVSTKDLLALSKKYKTSVTKFTIALYFKTLLDYHKTLPAREKQKNRPIVLNVPVDLRGLYDEKTLRNFFISITPSVDPRLGDYTIEELIIIVDSYFKSKITKKQIDRYLSRNIRNERTVALRLVPIWIKNLVMPKIYIQFGERTYTSSVSNLGRVTLPSELSSMVESFEVYPPPSGLNLLKICMISYKDNTTISFGSITNDRRIEREFFRNLRKMNAHIKIETNY